jgi:hypothetical protein
MKINSGILLMSFLACAACKKDTRTCKCNVVEEGMMTTTTSISILGLPAVPGEPSSQPYYNESEAVYKYDNVTKKDMNAACPTKITEDINETTVSSVSAVTLALEIQQENIGTRTKTCKIQ